MKVFSLKYRSRSSWLLFTLLIGQLAGAPGNPAGEPSLDFTAIYDDSGNWPFRVSVVEEFVPPGKEKALPKNRPAVVMRMEGQGASVLLDFGRLGLFSVPTQRTDFVMRYRALRDGSRTKTASNYRELLGTRLRIQGDLPGPRHLPEAMLQGLERGTILLLYVRHGADLNDFRSSLEAIDWEARDCLPVVIPLVDAETWGNDMAVLNVLREKGVGWPFLMRRFARAYESSFAHGESDASTWVLVDPSGKVLGQGTVAGSEALVKLIAF